MMHHAWAFSLNTSDNEIATPLPLMPEQYTPKLFQQLEIVGKRQQSHNAQSNANPV